MCRFALVWSATQNVPRLRLRIIGLVHCAARIDELDRMLGRGCYVYLDPLVSDEMKISDKIRKALKLEKGVPADFVEYLQARANSQNRPAGH